MIPRPPRHGATSGACWTASTHFPLVQTPHPGPGTLAMSPSHGTRPARDGEIPDRFIKNWRKSPKPTPPVRRGITACESCRAAKVRCNGQQDCQRCIARQLVCTYGHRTVSFALGPCSSHGPGKDLSGSLPASAHVTGQVQPQYLSSLVETSHTAATAAAAPSYLDSSSATQGPGTDVIPLSWVDALPSTVSSPLPSLKCWPHKLPEGDSVAYPASPSLWTLSTQIQDRT